MKPGPESVIRFLQIVALTFLLVLLPPLASAQTKSPPPPPPKKSVASAPSHPSPAPASPRTAGSAPTSHPGGTGGASSAHQGGNTGTAGANLTNTTRTANNHSTLGSNKATPGTAGTNKTTPGTSRTNRTVTGTTETDPRAPTGLNLRTPGATGAGNRITAGVGATRTNALPEAGGARPGATGAPNAINQPGTTKLANGGTKTLHANGSSVERNRSGKLIGVRTSNGATAKMDAYGKATSIHDGKGTTISRGPHGERRIETTRADQSRLVSTGRRGGYAERRFNRDGHEYALRSYYYNGRYYSRVYAPYSYGGRSYYGYVPAFYYEPLFYGWVYNAWPTPVGYAWGWYGAPWYAPYGYYFVPYAVYPAPSFWLADFALAESLQAAADEAASGSLRPESGLMYVSAHVSQQNQGQGSPLVTSVTKDEIAEQVKQMIADEKDAAGSVAPPAAPPSLDPRFALFIVSSELNLDAEVAACSISAGDIIRRKDYTPDGNNTVAVEVVSSKNGDCSAGTASRLKVDDLEEMHDNFRQKVDDGLKSLAENQGKGGIPRGPAATVHAVPQGQAAPDLTVESDLRKQQEAADATEKDVQDASSDSGSAG
jgi:hypothetical protein